MQGRVEEVLARAEYALNLSTEHLGLLDIALDQLSLGRTYHAQGNLPQAQHWLGQAVVGLREAGTLHNLPWALLARTSATLSASTMTDDADDVATYYTKAQQDLDEVRDIAEPSGMRLHLTDYYLQTAHLRLAQGKPTAEIQACLDQAAQLIKDTGYHRRDAELAALRSQLA
jgi:tetratricopeptide (TPR) repeat protein